MSSTTLRYTLALFVAAAAAATVVVADGARNFTFNHGFGAEGNMTLSGVAEIHPSGLLQLTNDNQHVVGHAFFPSPLRLNTGVSSNSSSPHDAFSFSTTFVFAIFPNHNDSFGDGMTFALSPTSKVAGGMPGEYLGLFNSSKLGMPSNHIVAVEFDTVVNVEIGDINNNHVGIDVNDLRSNTSAPASYFDGQIGGFKNLSLVSGQPIQVWIDYNGSKQEMSVTIAPSSLAKPSSTPLLKLPIDLSSILSTETYVGFTSSTGTATASHYVLGWSFCLNGEATPLDHSKLPPIPSISTIRKSPKKNNISSALIVGLSLAAAIMLLLVAFGLVVVVVRRRRKYAEILEDWESEYGPHRFSYKELYKATKGFHDDNFLGAGGFGRVYKGVLPSSKMEVAVKRVSNDSRQGMREFVAEIASMGRLRHRNLVQLLGYSRRQGELLLVYEYMPNGSLDRFLFYDGGDSEKKKTRLLSWVQRFQIAKGIAAGLHYLHEGGEQVVVHRDIKAGNVLLDGAMDGKLSDFGLARLYDHGDNPGTTRVMGTLGYMAPELTTTGKATTATDVYAFGCFLLEITCGRRPMGVVDGGEQRLVDWVLEWWNKGDMMKVVDPKMGGEYVKEEVEMVLQLGLLCSHPRPASRPSMKQVVQMLEGDASLPETSPENLSATFTEIRRREGFDELVLSCTLSTDTHIPRMSSSSLSS